MTFCSEFFDNRHGGKTSLNRCLFLVREFTRIHANKTQIRADLRRHPHWRAGARVSGWFLNYHVNCGETDTECLIDLKRKNASCLIDGWS
jgi:hypothetical protein